MSKYDLTAKELRTRIDYDPITGGLKWRETQSKKIKTGDDAGYITKHRGGGYRRVYLNGIGYMAHKLAWLHYYGQWPSDQIDHINRVRSDNRIENLREATQSENQANRKIASHNKSGFKGVTKHQRKWAASIRKNRLRIHIGVFDTPQEAHAAYCEAANKLHGSYASGA